MKILFAEMHGRVEGVGDDEGGEGVLEDRHQVLLLHQIAL